MAVNTLFSGTVTGNGDSGLQGSPTNELIGLFTVVTAVSGLLPSLTLTLQHSPDGGDNWFNVPNGGSVLNFNGINTVGNYQVYSPLGQLILSDIRLTWTVTGTNASFTFTTYIGTGVL